MRLDICLLEYFGISSRHKAQSLIMRGDVLIGTKPVTKSGYQIKEDEISQIKIKQVDPYVGFGAYKLMKAKTEFQLDLQGEVILDIGASTGGFVQYALEQGAEWVYAVDVGENQLSYLLRVHPQVISYEKTDARQLTESHFIKKYPTFFTVDVSFISLKFIFPILKKLCLERGVVLIKPQFEVGKEIKNFKGYVRNEEDIQDSINKVKSYAHDNGFIIKLLTPSPEQSEKKNQEYLGYILKI